MLSVGIPAVIAGLGVMLLYLSLPIGLYGTVWILVVAYSYRFATTTRLARAGFLQIHRELEEASATSGARWLATQRRVLVPLMLPALSAGFILLFIVGVREFTHSAGALQPGQRGPLRAVVAAVPDPASRRPPPRLRRSSSPWCCRSSSSPAALLARARDRGLAMLTVRSLAKSFAAAEGAVPRSTA